MVLRAPAILQINHIKRNVRSRYAAAVTTQEKIEERANKLGIKINLRYDFGSGRSDDAQ